MSKILATLLAAGFGLSMNAVTAQDVTSEGARAQRQEQLMKQKEQETGQSQSGARERATPSYERTQEGQSGDNSSAQSGQSAGDSSAQRDQSGTPRDDTRQQQTPGAADHQEGAQTGGSPSPNR